MSTMTTEIHMGEIIDAVRDVLEKRGLRAREGGITFRYHTGRAQERGRDTYLYESGSYLTAVCEVEPVPPKE
jgi:hypothetical protein